VKIFIAVDMEGISGICRAEQVTKGTADYAEARTYYIGDANAAALGALEGGADEIIIADMHGGGYGFALDKFLPYEEVQYLVGGGHWPRFPMLEECDALFLIGYHAMAGTPSAVLDHTMSSKTWQDFWINGCKMGETGIDASIAGHFGIPVMLVTGDDKVCAEAQELLGEIETAQVKVGLARERALVLPPVIAQKKIKEAAKRAVERIGEVAPLTYAGEVEIKLRSVMTTGAEKVPFEGGAVSRVDGRTVSYKGANVMEALRLLLG
jgi:D-amino peptidase